MENSGPFFDQARVIIARYLGGDEPFDAAARQLADLIRASAPSQADVDPIFRTGTRVPGQPMSLKKLSLLQWMDPRASYMPVLHFKTESLAPGRTPEDEERAHVLLQEALRLAGATGGDAA